MEEIDEIERHLFLELLVLLDLTGLNIRIYLLGQVFSYPWYLRQLVAGGHVLNILSQLENVLGGVPVSPNLERVFAEYVQHIGYMPEYFRYFTILAHAYSIIPSRGV